MNAPAALHDLSPDAMGRFVAAAFQEAAVEVPSPVQLPVLEGAIPEDLRGVVLRNGPGRFERGGVRYGHPFDGDGFLQRFAFTDGGVDYLARFVQTREFVDEEAAGRIVHRGFGTNRPGGLRHNAFRMRFKNAANTSIVQHAGHTLALWEGGLPHRIDPETLETLERFDYGGKLQNTRSWVDQLVNPELPFSAHPCVDPETGELWNFGTAFGRVNHLLVYRVDRSGTLHRRDIPLANLPFVHDFVLTRRFAVFVLPRVRFDVPRALLGLASPVASLTLEDGPGTALLVPRDGGPVVRIPVEPGFVFHWASAREDGDHLILEGVKYRSFPAFDDLPALFSTTAPDLLAELVRIELDLAQQRATETVLDPHPVELPVSSGGVMHATAAPVGRVHPFLSGLLRRDASGTMFRDLGCALPGEPLHAGNWLVVQVRTDLEASELWVLDPGSLHTVCRLGMPFAVPPALHGTWLSAPKSTNPKLTRSPHG
jgi:all-trans-8'-apo-beta-carotenal 15,15'-oxygenase